MATGDIGEVDYAYRPRQPEIMCNVDVYTPPTDDDLDHVDHINHKRPHRACIHRYDMLRRIRIYGVQTQPWKHYSR